MGLEVTGRYRCPPPYAAWFALRVENVTEAGLPIALGHIAYILGIGSYRGKETEIFQQWRAAIADLAHWPNVIAKLGGFGTIICGSSWYDRPMPPTSVECACGWRRYVEIGIDIFGTARCMFQSNFAADKAMYSYRNVRNVFKLLMAGASNREPAARLSGVAVRIYHIPIPVSVEIAHV